MAVVIQKRYPNVCKAISHDSVYGGTSSAHTKCARCNQTLSSSHSYTQASSGTWNSSHSSVSATKSCSCGYSYSVSTSSIRESVDTESTCATKGRYEHTATLGSKTYKCPNWHDLALDPSNHSNGFSSRLTPSTCITKGHYTYTCKNGCGYSYNGADLALNSSNHEGSSIYGGTASCHTKYSCCGVTISSSHDYGSWYEDVSWNSDCSACTGYYEACVCGYQESEDATSLIEAIDTRTATCTTPGTYEHYVYNGNDFYCGKTHIGQKNPNNHTGSSAWGGTQFVYTKWSCCGATISSVHDSWSLWDSPEFNCEGAVVTYSYRCNCSYVDSIQEGATFVYDQEPDCQYSGWGHHTFTLEGLTYTCGTKHSVEANPSKHVIIVQSTPSNGSCSYYNEPALTAGQYCQYVQAGKCTYDTRRAIRHPNYNSNNPQHQWGDIGTYVSNINGHKPNQKCLDLTMGDYTFSGCGATRVGSMQDHNFQNLQSVGDTYHIGRCAVCGYSAYQKHYDADIDDGSYDPGDGYYCYGCGITDDDVSVNNWTASAGSWKASI